MFKKGLFILFILISPAVYAQTIDIAVPQTISLGSNFDVRINLESDNDIYAAQFDLSFDPGIVEAVEVIYSNSNNNSTYATYSIDNNYGRIKFGVTSIGNYTLPSGLVNIVFKTTSQGKNTFDLQNVKVLNQELNEINISTSGKEIIIIKTTDTGNRKTDGVLRTPEDNKTGNENVANTDAKTNNDSKKGEELLNTPDNNKTGKGDVSHTDAKTREYNKTHGNESAGDDINVPGKDDNQNTPEVTNIKSNNGQSSKFLWILLIAAIVSILVVIKIIKK